MQTLLKVPKLVSEHMDYYEKFNNIVTTKVMENKYAKWLGYLVRVNMKVLSVA